MNDTFSLLMSVYGRERPEFLEQSLVSVFASQMLPSELVLVEDGPLTNGLREVIEAWRSRMPIKSVRLEHNVGLPAALNAGLQQVSHELVARFDTDDLCEPSRFAKQFQFLVERPSVAAVGAWVEEFDTHTGTILAMRSPPSGHEALVHYAKLRSPMNHPSVMFRRSAVLQVGAYESDVGFEDYSLWLRLILAGFQLANIPKVLVRMRAGSSLVARRRGLKYARNEISFVRKFRQKGFFTAAESIWYLALHTPFRMLPQEALNSLYQRGLRKRHAS